MSFVLYEESGQVGIITINRPKELNALNSQVYKDLSDVLENVDQEKIRCLVLTGSGEKSFVAGADIKEMVSMNKQEAKDFSIASHAALTKLETFPLPVIAAINGYALGGGCELALSCDIRLAAEEAVIGLVEVTLGITPGSGGTQRLARIVGTGIAKQMLYTAARIDAAEAYRIGLVNEVYPRSELMDAAMKMAGKIAVSSPFAVRMCKKAVNEGIQVPIDQAIEIEVELFSDCFRTSDQKGAMEFFLNKVKGQKFQFKNK